MAIVINSQLLINFIIKLVILSLQPEIASKALAQPAQLAFVWPSAWVSVPASAMVGQCPRTLKPRE